LANSPKKGSEEAASPPVLTGHADGLITLDIAEADEVERERIRRKLRERYRTLLGHFRHESGHYFWDRLIRGTSFVEPFRALFGDEREDYGEALKRHYAGGPPANCEERFISPYASSHPWEDWAETWAHYLHMMDTLDTSRCFGIASRDVVKEIVEGDLLGPSEGAAAGAKNRGPFADVLRDWIWLSLAMNAINRSMGVSDVYPFVLNRAVAEKLEFVHEVVHGARAPRP
jgi:hypothetical protein